MELYRLTFPNGKAYIGISQDSQARLKKHMSNARQGVQLPVYRAIRKHGHPLLEILCIGQRDYIADLEVKAIETFQTRGRKGYNVSPGGDLSPTGDQRVRKKISKSNKGREITWGDKIAKTLTGYKQTPEAIEAARITRFGKKRSEETKQRMKIAAYKRAPMSQATKDKIGKSLIGNTNRRGSNG